MTDEPGWAQRPWEKGPGSADTAGGKSAGGNVAKTGSGGLGCLGLVILVIGVAVSCSVLGSNDGPSAPSSFEAELQCQDWLRDKLLAPSTAEFSQTTTSGGPTSWTVTGVVDAENGFGATLRSSWTCSIRIDGDMWRGSATLLD